jgi:hypothetical protein
MPVIFPSGNRLEPPFPAHACGDKPRDDRSCLPELTPVTVALAETRIRLQFGKAHGGLLAKSGHERLSAE